MTTLWWAAPMATGNHGNQEAGSVTCDLRGWHGLQRERATQAVNMPYDRTPVDIGQVFSFSMQPLAGGLPPSPTAILACLLLALVAESCCCFPPNRRT